ncbi:MAG TPA: MFS transporter [Gracilimonas sp.]|uniref:MFS transporter n=1 Tax=Gracilimonas sp. TaxID=1974203 RepID=UPI002DA5978D|nr:MFS transporter [Gracilimonas sp.]
MPVIVFSQFAGTSLWFAGNAVVPDLIAELGLLESTVGYITMAVQAGFIIGTLVFAILNVADRISPVKVFLACSFLGAAFNGLTIFGGSFTEIMSARFLTGFFLAGIYPVGMKIASDWHKEGLGKALGYLVGALVIGTAFPHFLKFAGGDLPWRFVLISTSVISFSGGLTLFFTVSDGPYKGKAGSFRPSALFTLFRDKNFRSAAFGYFGHMWELYTFWAFVPVMLAYYVNISGVILNIPLWSFIIIGIGGISCAVGGHLSLKIGSKKVAFNSLLISGLCCLLIPFLFQAEVWLFIAFLMIWGIFVISDSPQFSAMVAGSADRSYVATGLTIVNSLGFAITIVSIQLVTLLWTSFEDGSIFWVMLAGPLFGLISVSKFKTKMGP